MSVGSLRIRRPRAGTNSFSSSVFDEEFQLPGQHSASKRGTGTRTELPSEKDFVTARAFVALAHRERGRLSGVDALLTRHHVTAAAIILFILLSQLWFQLVFARDYMPRVAALRQLDSCVHLASAAAGSEVHTTLHTTSVSRLKALHVSLVTGVLDDEHRTRLSQGAMSPAQRKTLSRIGTAIHNGDNRLAAQQLREFAEEYGDATSDDFSSARFALLLLSLAALVGVALQNYLVVRPATVTIKEEVSMHIAHETDALHYRAADYRRMQRLADITSSLLASGRDLRSLMRHVMGETCRLVRADTCVLFLRDGDRLWASEACVLPDSAQARFFGGVFAPRNTTATASTTATKIGESLPDDIVPSVSSSMSSLCDIHDNVSSRARDNVNASMNSLSGFGDDARDNVNASMHSLSGFGGSIGESESVMEKRGRAAQLERRREQLRANQPELFASVHMPIGAAEGFAVGLVAHTGKSLLVTDRMSMERECAMDLERLRTLPMGDGGADDRDMFTTMLDKATSMCLVPVGASTSVSAESRVDSGSMGVLVVMRAGEVPLSDDDENLLTLVASQTHIALHHARMHAEGVSSMVHQETVLEAIATTVTTFDALGRYVSSNHPEHLSQFFHFPTADDSTTDASSGGVTFRRLMRGHKTLLADVHAVYRTGNPISDVIYDLDTPHGTRVTISYSVSPLLMPDLEHNTDDSSGVPTQLSGVIVCIEDITAAKRARQALGRYLSPQVLSKVMADADVCLGGVRQHATVLFSDVRGFTSLSEEMNSGEVVQLLNEHFDVAVAVSEHHSGVVLSFIGDCLMAAHGVPFAGEHDALDACLAALDLVVVRRRMNVQRRRRGLREIHVGVGLNTGDLTCGNIGSTKRLDYTVIGDTVNLAARTESLTKFFGVLVLATEATIRAAGPSKLVYREVDRCRVAGKSEAIAFYELICPRVWHGERAASSNRRTSDPFCSDDDDISTTMTTATTTTATTPQRPAVVTPVDSEPLPDDACDAAAHEKRVAYYDRLCSDYALALEAYRRRDFATALAAFDDLVVRFEGDPPSARMAKICRPLVDSPLPANWEPITQLSK